ncbi:hypothetical protein Cabys_1837 [Caldithrix abyssi DSM 13497]|uniref:Uncharacterized protein n=1 Tax=Caldithrix abyssi DSM 13497 TaxID=880073 RepID=A0A1J1C9B5_CALAY|nr:hypothetical protein Cabys_1837 [Caldithrix abyssi DSM 13497]
MCFIVQLYLKLKGKVKRQKHTAQLLEEEKWMCFMVRTLNVF